MQPSQRHACDGGEGADGAEWVGEAEDGAAEGSCACWGDGADWESEGSGVAGAGCVTAGELCISGEGGAASGSATSIGIEKGYSRLCVTA